jgi:DNA processing protein
MALPGSPLDSRSHGCNQLIRDGAVLVQSPDDVMELLSGFTGAPRSRLRDPAPEPHFAIAEELADPADVAGLLGQAPVAIDELIRQSGESPAAVQLALLELELAGRLVRHAAGRVSIAG